MRRAVLVLLVLVPALAGCATPPEVPLRARAGDFAVVDLVAWDDHGDEVRNRSGARAVLGSSVPPRLPDGWDAAKVEALPPGVVEALAGQAAGAVVDTGLLPPERAYGAWDEARTIRAPRVETVPREVTVAAADLEGSAVRWANLTWQAEVLARNGSQARVRLTSGPPVGVLLELPAYWNDHYRLWRSRLLGSEAAALRVAHEAERGTEALVGGVRYRVVADGTGPEGAVVADGNPPLAGQALRFRVALREVEFAGSGAHPPAPDVLLVSEAGAPFHLGDLRGKAVLLDFFATWCVTCKQQAPLLARLAQEHRDRLAVVSVTIDPTDDAARVQAFRADALALGPSQATAGNWSFAFDPTGEAARAFSVTGIPRSVLVDMDGRIRASSVGLVPWAELKSQVAAALAAP